jgi:mono/diheme cytochrome c family protein
MMRNFFIGLISGLALLFVVLAVYFFSGIFDISTAASHPVIEMLMDKIKDRSVDWHSKDKLQVTSENSDLKEGASYFMKTCVICHGAPGYDRMEFAGAILPLANDLSDKGEIVDLTDPKLSWIIKNGIRMTAMPAFGQIRSDAEINNVILFVKELQNMKKEDIDKLVK